MKLIRYCLLVITAFSLQATYAQTTDSIPVHDSLTIVSEKLGETRKINVWLPPAYATSRDSLPVLYMLDGGINEDFPHVANTLAALIQQKKVPSFILVGIENTQRRRDLTGPTDVETDKKIAPVVGGAEKFRDFLADELFAAISSRYLVTGKRGIIGESLAGLFVVETMLLKPELFDYYIAFDPSLWWNNGYLVKQAGRYLSKHVYVGKRFWFAGSGEKTIYQHTRSFAKLLQSRKPKGFVWKYNDEPQEQHGTIFRATKEQAIVWALSE